MSALEKRQADTRDAIARGTYVCDGPDCPLNADECGCCSLLGTYKPPAEREQQDTDAREEGLDAEPRNKEFPPACCRDCEHVEHCRAVDENDPQCQKERKDWLAERQTSIGASDAAATLNVDPYCSMFKKWSEKTGICAPPSLDDVEQVYWGNAHEPAICRRFSELTGREVHHNDKYELVRHPDRLWMTATLDAIQIHPQRGRAPLECKSIGYMESIRGEWADDGKGKVKPPLFVEVQLQHQIAAGGFAWGSIAVLIAGQKMLWFDMDRDDAFIEQMMAKEAWFWTQVLDKIPVPVDGSIATTDTLKRLYPKDDGEIISLPESCTNWDINRQYWKEQKKTAEGSIREFENLIKAALGNATCGILPNGDQYTFKQQTNHYPAKEASESSFRVLRRKANK